MGKRRGLIKTAQRPHDDGSARKPKGVKLKKKKMKVKLGKPASAASTTPTAAAAFVAAIDNDDD
eukprot:4605493-Prymnesium_polylepis.1